MPRASDAATFAWYASEPSSFSSSGLLMNATSTSTAGIDGADQHAEGRLLHAAPLAAGDDRELLLDARGERRRLLEVLGLRHVPEDEREVRARPPPGGGSAAPSGWAMRRDSSSLAW